MARDLAQIGRGRVRISERLREALAAGLAAASTDGDRAALGLAVRTVRPADVRPLVPVEPEPLERVEDVADVLLGGAVAVGVLDAEDERSAVMAREEPVEERGAGAADVEIAGGRRSEADAGSHREEKLAVRVPPVPVFYAVVAETA